MNKKFLMNNYKDIMELLNCIKVGVYVVDGEGKTVLLNDESCTTGGLTRDEVLGKTMKELEDIGFVENSVSLRTLKSGKEEEIVQNLGDGDKIFVTSKPVFDNGKIELVVCTERNITEAVTLKKLLMEQDRSKEKTKEEVEYLKRQNMAMWGNVIAEDESTKLIAEKALRVAKLDTTVLLLGDSGTGKEVFANFIYENSSRAGKPFIKVNCAAIPDNLMESQLFGYEGGAFTGADKKGKMGMFEMANQGTLFLDEIGEIPLNLQSKLLRALQEREIIRVGGSKVIPIDIRLITATNRNLKKAVEEGKFREDLYYRINIMPITLEPLKNRKKDIRALANYFTEQFNSRYKLNKVISDEAMAELCSFEWPGNIRELENVMERIMISFDGDVVTKFQVQRAIGKPVSSNQPFFPATNGKSMQELMDDYEKLVLQAMFEEHGKASDVARALKMNKSTLSRRVKKYGLGDISDE